MSETLLKIVFCLVISYVLVDIIFLRTSLPTPPNKLFWVIAVFVVFVCFDYFFDLGIRRRKEVDKNE